MLTPSEVTSSSGSAFAGSLQRARPVRELIRNKEQTRENN